MYCKECGAKIPDDSKFCVKCGTRTVETESEPKNDENVSENRIKANRDAEKGAKRASALFQFLRKYRIIITIITALFFLFVVFVVVQIVNNHKEEYHNNSFSSSSNSSFSFSNETEESNTVINAFGGEKSFNPSTPGSEKNVKLVGDYIKQIGTNYTLKIIGYYNDSGMVNADTYIMYEFDKGNIHEITEANIPLERPVKREQYYSGNQIYSFDEDSGTWTINEGKELSDVYFLLDDNASWTVDSISETNSGYMIRGILHDNSMAPGDFEYTLEIRDEKPVSFVCRYKSGAFAQGTPRGVKLYISEIQIYDIGTTKVSLPN